MSQSNQAEINRGAERASLPYTLHEFDIPDTFVTDQQGRIRDSLAELEAMGFFGDTDIEHALKRKRLSAIDYTNPATAELIARIPGVEHWLALVPTAKALEPLYRPDISHLPNGHEIGPELYEWLANIADAEGIRDRAERLKTIYHKRTPESTDEPEEWLSLASGVAQPVLEAAQRMQQETGIAPNVTLADLDSSALTDARRYATELGLVDSVELRRANILRRVGLDEPISPRDVALDSIQRMMAFRAGVMPLSRKPFKKQHYKKVELVGITEYMGEEDWLYKYNQVVPMRTMMAGARTLLRNAYDLLKPGGSLVVGNMLIDRPEIAFTLNTIQWPHIQPRSIDDMMTLFDNAELEGERHVYASPNPRQRIYALYEIIKPES